MSTAVRRRQKYARMVARSPSEVLWKWQDRSHLVNRPSTPTGLRKAYTNELYAVQVFYHIPTDGPWSGANITHLMVTVHKRGTVIPWEDLQRIKDDLIGCDRIAIEVFPVAKDVTNAAPVRHLWVLPESATLGIEREWV